MRTERDLQHYLKRRCKETGLLIYHFSSPAHRGVPDFIVVWPSGAVSFVETKSPAGTGRLSTLQVRTIERLQAQGADVRVIASVEAVERFLTEPP